MLTTRCSDRRDSAVCFLNNLSGDVHAHVACLRHSGDEKNCT
jgi:hypothetical protein